MLKRRDLIDASASGDRIPAQPAPQPEALLISINASSVDECLLSRVNALTALLEMELTMKTKLIAVASAAVIGLTALAMPNQAKAHWNGGWWIPGAIIGGLALGAAIASRPYYYGPGYYGYGYPYYYGYGPYYYGYGSYYGYRPYYYGGPRYYYGRPYRHYRRYYR
jgi:hypothetical protein